MEATEVGLPSEKSSGRFDTITLFLSSLLLSMAAGLSNEDLQ